MSTFYVFFPRFFALQLALSCDVPTYLLKKFTENGDQTMGIFTYLSLAPQ